MENEQQQDGGRREPPSVAVQILELIPVVLLMTLFIAAVGVMVNYGL